MTFTFDMPPSINALYVKRRGSKGGKALTAAAKAYREHVKRVVGKDMLKISGLLLDTSGTGEKIYGLDATFYFQKLENPDWFAQKRFIRGKRKGELKVKLRYKRVDVDNRLKFLQDWLVRCIGLPDDAIIFQLTARKVQTEGPEHVEAKLHLLDREEFLPPAPEDDPEWQSPECRSRSVRRVRSTTKK